MSVRVGATWLLTLVAVTLLAYGWPQNHEFLHWDDVSYVSANPFVQELSAGNLRWMLFGVHLYNWHPVTWLSYAINDSLFGLEPTAFAVTNLLLHAVNAGLVGLIALQLCRHFGIPQPQSRLTAVLAAVLFAVHPQHVESVIWIAERKDLLCGLFYFLAVHSYLRAGSRPAGTALPRLLPLWAMLALMSKSMAVSLPVVLMVLDLWVLGRVRKSTWLRDLVLLLREKTSLIVLTAAVCAITLLTQAPQSLAEASVSERLVNAARAFVHYPLSLFWPGDLSPYYPYAYFVNEPVARQALWVVTSLLLIAGIAAWGLRGRGWSPMAVLASYAIAVLPVIGLVKVGQQAFADRYAYIPLVGLYITAAWGLATLHFRLAKPWLTYALTGSLLAAFASQTHRYAPVWQSDASLWRHVVERYPMADAVPYSNLGNIALLDKRYAEAEAHYRNALMIDPDNRIVYSNLVRLYDRSGRHAESGETLTTMMLKFPDYIDIWRLCADVALGHSDLAAAEACLQRALALQPNDPQSWYQMAELHSSRGEYEQEIAALKRVPWTSQYFSLAQEELRKLNADSPQLP